MCMGTKEEEIETFRRLITQTYPDGIVSIVSDTWDYWKVLTEYVPELKDEILAREGILTIRPDSGDPVKILVGDSSAPVGSPQHKGSFQLMWEILGGEINDKGFKVLAPQINLIYGDSITLERAKAITSGLIEKGFMPKMILGIGSYTYQYNTRDTLGFAMKATFGVVNGVEQEIFKDPVTDDGTKKSARGLIAVNLGENGYEANYPATWDEVYESSFQPVFVDGETPNLQNLSQIRARLRNS